MSQLNDMFKYADDTTLLVPEHTDISIDIDFFEFNHVKAWAAINGLTFNLNKTKEIVFRRHRAHSFHLPPVIDNIQQLNCSKLLVVLFQPNLKMDFHVHVMIMILTTLFYYVYTHFRQVHIYCVLPLPYIVTFTALRQWLVPTVADEPTNTLCLFYVHSVNCFMSWFHV